MAVSGRIIPGPKPAITVGSAIAAPTKDDASSSF